MRFLIVGCGSIGQRHLKNLTQLGHEVIGCEIDQPKASKVKKDFSVEVFSSLQEALKKVYDGAFVCAPTSFHIPLAIELAKKGVNLFIEKPLSNNLTRIDELVRTARAKRLVCLVGCNLIFLSGFKQVRRLLDENKIGKVISARIECGFYLPFWHPKEDYRRQYSAHRSLGGGVIFDDIHELDLLYRIFGKVKDVFCFAKKMSSLKIDTEDIAEIFLKFKSGQIAQIHLDYLQPSYRRYYEFIGEKGVIAWDFIREKIELYTKEPNRYEVFEKSINASHNQMFIDEAKHFVNCIKKREKSLNDLSFAKKVLELSLACHASAQKGRIVRI